MASRISSADAGELHPCPGFGPDLDHSSPSPPPPSHAANLSKVTVPHATLIRHTHHAAVGYAHWTDPERKMSR